MLGPLIMLLGASAAVKTTCSSTMKGDYVYEACGGFCKESKKSSHCKWCKCKQCSHCASGGTSSISSATDAAAPGATPVSSIGESPFKKNATKKKRRVKVQAPAMSDAAVAASPAAAAPSNGTSAVARKTCRSGIKGDFAYEACGGFCKEAKKLNHCKWCKCKDCGFCSGSAAAAGAGAKPHDGDGSGGGSSSGGGGGGGGGSRSHRGAGASAADADADADADAVAAAAVADATSSGAPAPAADVAGGGARSRHHAGHQQTSLGLTPGKYNSAHLEAAHSFSFALLIVGLVVVCVLGGCWRLHTASADSGGGAIPGFGGGRVRAERSQYSERKGILRIADEDDNVYEQRSGLDDAFADVVKLEQSLRSKAPKS